MLMMDPKMVELIGYNGVPHLQCPVVTEMDKVVGALRLVLAGDGAALHALLEAGRAQPRRLPDEGRDEAGAEEIPYLVVIIDELADLMMTAPDDVETVLCRLAQMGRAAGIHLIIATQRPSVDVLTGLIKANVPARIAFAVTSLTDSRVVLDMPGAERLLGRGDMLFLPPDAAKPVRVQGAFIEDRDVQYIVDHWHSVAPMPHYAPEWLELPSSSAPANRTTRATTRLLEQAMSIVRSQGTASASMLQRRLRIGYNRAARLDRANGGGRDDRPGGWHQGSPGSRSYDADKMVKSNMCPSFSGTLNSEESRCNRPDPEGPAAPVARLIEELGKLPGVGPKTASRLAFHCCALRARRRSLCPMRSSKSGAGSGYARGASTSPRATRVRSAAIPSATT